jgi:hypothetical protein
MNRKYWLLILFFTLSLSKIQATPDRERNVLDRFIGLNGINIIVHQIVYDNLGSHYNGIIEEYIIEKYMENGNTSIIKQIKITKQNTVENILLKEYKGKIKYIFPDILAYSVNFLTIKNNEYIEIGDETRINLIANIPKELNKCSIIRIVDIYYEKEYVYLTIDLHDKINNYRKVIMVNIATNSVSQVWNGMRLFAHTHT